MRCAGIASEPSGPFYKPPKPIETRYPAVLSVRDLASGFVVANLSVPSMQLIHIADALAVLFEQHGPPLVLKSDTEILSAQQNLRTLRVRSSSCKRKKVQGLQNFCAFSS